MNGLPHIPSPALNGLLDAISNAAEWDEQISEGKSLSEREEAVLQGLELLSRQSNETVWIKGADLRENIRTRAFG